MKDQDITYWWNDSTKTMHVACTGQAKRKESKTQTKSRMSGRKGLKQFYKRDGWECYKKTEHYIYRKIDKTWNLLLTKVSMGNGEILQAYLKGN